VHFQVKKIKASEKNYELIVDPEWIFFTYSHHVVNGNSFPIETVQNHQDYTYLTLAGGLPASENCNDNKAFVTDINLLHWSNTGIRELQFIGKVNVILFLFLFIVS